MGSGRQPFAGAEGTSSRSGLLSTAYAVSMHVTPSIADSTPRYSTVLVQIVRVHEDTPTEWEIGGDRIIEVRVLRC